MPFITLTTDWGIRDYYAAGLKGRLHKLIPEVVITDISHHIAHYNIQQAAFVFSSSWAAFPAGTLHIVAVTLHNNPSELLAIKKDGHIFIGPNNGLFSMVFDETPVDMVAVDQPYIAPAGYDLNTMAGIAAHLLGGKNLYELGQRPEQFVEKTAFKPVLEEDIIRGTVIYIDEFGNVVTNITKVIFEEQRRGRRFEIITRLSRSFIIDKISTSYSEHESAAMFAIFNEAGYLEIGTNMDKATGLLGLKYVDTVRIEFK